MESRSTLAPDSPAAPLQAAGFVSASGDTVTRPRVVTYLNSHPGATKHAVLTRLRKRFGSRPFAHGFFNAPAIRQTDPFILLLLADQEFGEGDEEQARYLIEAAYEAYDQQKEPCVFRIRPVS